MEQWTFLFGVQKKIAELVNGFSFFLILRLNFKNTYREYTLRIDTIK